MLLTRTPRRGTVLIEAALVYPVVFMVLAAILILSIIVFRYQQVAHMAREASRWAAVHGTVYASEQNTTAATADDIYTKAITPQAAGMHMGDVTYSVTWNTSNSPTRVDTSSGTPKYVYNTVSVTVTYTWHTGIFGTIPVTSTSVTPMSY